MKYFFACTIPELVQFTPFASTSIPSKKELLILSAKLLAIYCASIPDLLLCFATVSGCEQLVVVPTHVRCGTLDLLITVVPDLVQVALEAATSNSDHYTLSAEISMAQAVPNLCVSRKVFHQVNRNTVCCAIQDMLCRNIWLADNPIEILLEYFSLLVGCYLTTKVIRVCNKYIPWLDYQCNRAFCLKQ